MVSAIAESGLWNEIDTNFSERGIPANVEGVQHTPKPDGRRIHTNRPKLTLDLWLESGGYAPDVRRLIRLLLSLTGPSAVNEKVLAQQPWRRLSTL